MSAEANWTPDNYWFDGQVASWQDPHSTDLRLFEVIANPKTFSETVNSPGDPEIIKLFHPQPGQVLTLTFVDPETSNELNQEITVLDEHNPETEIAKGARFILDAMKTTTEGPLSYICRCIGVSPDMLS